MEKEVVLHVISVCKIPRGHLVMEILCSEIIIVLITSSLSVVKPCEQSNTTQLQH